MEDAEKREVIASSSLQRKRNRGRRLRKRRRRNEKRVLMVPSSLPNDVLEEIFLRFPVKH
ncbi:putative F-box/kelch-repeat protein [Arabidopsis thaliana]